MPKLLQINVTVNSGSTGRIAEHIGELSLSNGWESWIAYGRKANASNSNLIKIGNLFDIVSHGIQTRIFDNHGLASKHSTKQLIETIKNKVKPDLIHLHNIHGYYLNYPLLFDFLKEWGGPVVWTLHDCWPFTGHCAHYDYLKCNKWESLCFNCPQLKRYPASYLMDRSKNNFKIKYSCFTSLNNLTIVSVSNWLRSQISKSFLSKYPCEIIYNGIDSSVYKPLVKKNGTNQFTVLGVASVWDERKGLNDFINLRSVLPRNYDILLVGLNRKQINNLPNGISGLERVSSTKELALLYNKASVYVNTSVEETLGMTTIEAMACGTPAVVYDATASPEVIEKNSCRIIKPRDILSLKDAIMDISSRPTHISTLRDWVMKNFEKTNNYMKYLKLYNKLLNID